MRESALVGGPNLFTPTLPSASSVSGSFDRMRNLAAVVVVFAATLSACDSEENGGTLSCPARPTTGPGVSRLDLGAPVTNVAEGQGAMWALRRRHGSRGPSDLVEFDPLSGRVLGKPVRIRPPGVDIDVGHGAVWVVRRRGILVRVDPNSHRVVARIPVGRGPRNVAAGEGGVWVTNTDDNTVSRVDPSVNRVVATVTGVDHPSLVLARAGAVWVKSEGSHVAFHKIEPSLNRVSATVEMDLRAVRQGAVWVVAPGGPNGVLRRLDPDSLRPVGPVLGLDILPAAVGIAGRQLWVGKYFHYCGLHNSPQGTPIISFGWFRVDPITLQVMSGPAFVGENTGMPVFASDAFWIAPDLPNELIKINLAAAARVRAVPTEQPVGDRAL
jgi:YVTN family beta-propeller protein